MKIFRFIAWMLAGMTAMLLTLYHYFHSEWQQATFWLVAMVLADFNFYRAYDEIIEESKKSGSKPPPLSEKIL